MTSVPLRVLVLADSRSFHTERYVTALRQHGCDVLLASLEDGPIEHHSIPQRGPFPQLYYYLARGAVRSLIGKWQPDVVNPHFATGYGWLAARARGRMKVPIVLHLWGSDILLVPQKSLMHRRKAIRALDAAALVVSDSQYMLDRAARLAPVGNGLIFPWGVESRFLRQFEPRKSISRPLRILAPRPHERVYNNLFILEALRPSLEAGDCQLTIPESGSLVDEFRRQAGSLTETAVKLYPRLERDAFVRMVMEHDVYVSAAQSDSSPASLIESMGLGLIPIVGDITGVQEWADSGVLLYPLSNGSALRALVRRILAEPGQFAKARETNHARVVRDATFEDVIGQTVSHMRTVVGEIA